MINRIRKLLQSITEQNNSSDVSSTEGDYVVLEKNKRASGSPTATVTQDALPEINSKDKIPDYESIESVSGGDYPLPENVQENYLILKDRSGTYLFLRAKSDSSFDHYALSIKNSFSQKHVYKEYLADKNIIKIARDLALAKTSNTIDPNEQSSLVVEIDNIIKDATERNVSDIHVEVRRDDAELKYRVNGALLTMKELSPKYAFNLCSVIYSVLAEEKDVTFNPDKTQDAVCERAIGSTRMRIRVATIPAYPKGFDMVMRLLPMGLSGKKKSMASLGYNEEQIESIEVAKSKPVGVIIMAGTTGSGKSTSLTTMISDLIVAHNNQIKVITVEDPPEYQIFGATQSPVVRSKNSKEGENPFAATIRAAMRSDPDVIMIGEVRDELSGELLVHAVQSGHQAFTTIHAPSAIGIISRLRSLGVPTDVIGSNDFLSGLIYQTLLPTLCESCKIPLEEWAKYNSDQNSKQLLDRIYKTTPKEKLNSIFFKNPKGCSHEDCNVGISGRSVVAEIIIPDPTMIELLGESKDAKALQYFRESGGKTALDNGIEKMLTGVFDPRDVEHKLNRLDSQPELLSESKMKSELLQ